MEKLIFFYSKRSVPKKPGAGDIFRIYHYVNPAVFTKVILFLFMGVKSATGDYCKLSIFSFSINYSNTSLIWSRGRLVLQRMGLQPQVHQNT